MNDAVNKTDKTALKPRVTIFKYMLIGLNISLSLCGIVFLVLTYTILKYGNKHRPQSYVKCDVISLNQAINGFKLDTNQYPQKLSDLNQDTNQSMWKGSYVKKSQLINPWGQPYYDRFFPKRNGYQLYFSGSYNRVDDENHASDKLSHKSEQLIAPLLNIKKDF